MERRKKRTAVKGKSKAELLKARRQKITSGKGGGDMFYISKEGKYRMRSVPVEEDMENAIEVVRFYLGAEIKGVISPASLGLPCALHEHYDQLLDSGDEDDKDTASQMGRGTRFVMPHYRYKDEKGSEVDHDAGVRFLMMTGGQYQEWIDLYLDDEIGDPSDPRSGFDIKYTREGTGKMDTKYGLIAMRSSPCDKKFRKPVNPEEMLRKILPSYDETKTYLDRFLGGADDDDDPVDDLKERKKKKITSAKKKRPVKKKVSRR